MSKPAVAVNSRPLGYVTSIYDGSYGHFENTTSGRMTSWDRDYHPASVSAPKDKKFRYCAGYTHDGCSFKFGKDQARAVYPPWGGQYLYEGNIWDLGEYINPIVKPDLPSSNLCNMGLVECLNNLTLGDFNTGEFLGELRETVNMVSHHSRSIAKSITKYKGSNGQWKSLAVKKDFMRAVKYEGIGNLQTIRCRVPRTWLELQYGWVPLLNDIFGAFYHLIDRYKFGLPYVTARSYVDAQDTVSVPMRSWVAYANSTATGVLKQEVHTYLVYSVSSPIMAELSSLGLINPAALVWALKRYSFVYDWFIPIQDWLSSLTAATGLTFVTGGQSLVSRVTNVRCSTPVRSSSAPSSYQLDEATTPRVSGSSFNFKRTCYSGTPVPGIYVKNPINVQHALNGIALVATALTPYP